MRWKTNRRGAPELVISLVVEDHIRLSVFWRQTGRNPSQSAVTTPASQAKLRAPALSHSASVHQNKILNIGLLHLGVTIPPSVSTATTETAPDSRNILRNNVKIRLGNDGHFIHMPRLCKCPPVTHCQVFL